MLTHVFKGLDTLQWTAGVRAIRSPYGPQYDRAFILRGIAKEFEYVAAYRHLLCLYRLIDRRLYLIHRQQLNKR